MRKNSLTEANFKYLTRKSEGYSGADIVFVVNSAFLMPLSKYRNEAHFKETTDGSWIPTDSDDPEGRRMAMKDIDRDLLCFPEATFLDFKGNLK